MGPSLPAVWCTADRKATRSRWNLMTMKLRWRLRWKQTLRDRFLCWLARCLFVYIYTLVYHLLALCFCAVPFFIDFMVFFLHCLSWLRDLCLYVSSCSSIGFSANFYSHC